jgi:diguanylate cyclase (GGDEF)-like protein
VLRFFPDDIKQRRLIERYLLSVSAYILCVSLAWIARATDLTTISYPVISAATLAICVYLVVLYLAYRTRLNLRLEDSAFTRIQMLVAVAWITYFVWSTLELRGVMLLIYVFVSMFSLFTLSTWQTAVMALVSSLLYGFVIVMDFFSQREGFDFTVNLVQWSVLSIVLIWMVAIAGYMNAVRNKIRQSNQMIRAQNEEIRRTNEHLESALAELSHMVTVDELTGLSNRRHFLEVVNEHIAASSNDRLEFGLCVLDLDHFKQINDTLGHLVGDKMLRDVADIMRQQMREYDFLARFGGEEFTLIVTRGDEATIRSCAERLRRAVEAAEFPELKGRIDLTVSIGATVFMHGDTLEDALSRADAAMYAAKKAGRNTCVMRLGVSSTQSQVG